MKKILQRGTMFLLIAGMLTGSALAASKFPDVSDSQEYAEAVQTVSNFGIMVGDENGNFNPDNTVTRAEMAVILCNMQGVTGDLTTNGALFTDVPADHWANPYVVKAAELGLINGYGNGQFGPSDGVTYEQVVTMFIQSWGLGAEAESLGGYPDGYVTAAVEHGVTGINELPGELGAPLTRWQVAVLVNSTMR